MNNLSLRKERQGRKDLIWVNALSPRLDLAVRRTV